MHRKLWYLCVCGFIWVAILLPTASTEAQTDEKTWLLNQINNLRAQLGIHAYAWNNQLAAAAQQHSEYMASTGDVSHTESNGSTPWDRALANGYGGSWISENIYGGGMAAATDAWNFWINSSIHYAGLTNVNTNEIGVGVAQGTYGQYYTLVFGRGDIQTAPAEPVNNPPPADSSSESVPSQPQSQPPAPVATRRPSPPTQTFTPSPTIPTFTPTVTWTLTPTWTASPTLTPLPPSSTPIFLPTAAVVTPIVTAVAQAVGGLSSNPSMPRPTAATRQTSTQVKKDGGIRDWLPYLLAGQVILIGVGAISLFMRRKT